MKRTHDEGWVLCPSKRFPGKLYYFNLHTGEAAWSLTELEQKMMNKNFIQQADKWHSYPEPDEPPADDVWMPYKSQPFRNQVPSVFGQAVFPKYPTNAESYPSTMMWSPVPNQMIPMSSPMNTQNMHMASPIQHPQNGSMTIQMGHPYQGHAQSQTGYTLSQGNMQSQMGHMAPQDHIMQSQMGHITPQGHLQSQTGCMSSQGHMQSQIEHNMPFQGYIQSQMRPMQSQGHMQYQMRHMPSQDHMQSQIGSMHSQGHVRSQMGQMQSHPGYMPPQGHMQSQVGYMAPQMGPMSSQIVLASPMGSMTSQMGPMSSQTGLMNSPMGPMASQIGPITSQLDQLTFGMGPMTPQMVQIPMQPVPFKPMVYKPYNQLWHHKPSSQPIKWTDESNQMNQNSLHYNVGPKQWPSYDRQNMGMPMQARSVFMPKLAQRNQEQPTQTQTMERQRGFNQRNNECWPENQKIVEIPKINVVRNQRTISLQPLRQTESMLRKNISNPEENIADSSGLYPVNNKEGNYVNKQQYFGMQTPKDATKFTAEHSENMIYADDMEFEVQDSKPPFVPSENYSVVSNEELTPVKNRNTLSLPIPKYDENIDNNSIKSLSFENITELEDNKATENEVKNIVPSKSPSENNEDNKASKNPVPSKSVSDNEMVEQVTDRRELDRSDLRYTLLAKRKIPREGNANEQERKTEVRKIKTSYPQDYKPEPKKKRVRFNLEPEELDYEYDDDHDMEVNGAPPSEHGHSIHALRGLGSVPDGDTWFIVVDTDVLIEDYEFIVQFVSGDPTCVLLVPDAVRREIEALSRGDHRGRQRVLGARNLARKLADPPQHVSFQDPDLEEMMMTELSLARSIIHCCLLVCKESHHVVFVTNNVELFDKALEAQIFTRFLNEIKNEDVSKKPEVSFEFKKIKTSNSEVRNVFDKMMTLQSKERESISDSYGVIENSEENNNNCESKETKERFSFFKYRYSDETGNVNKVAEESNVNKMADYDNERFPVSCFRKHLFTNSDEELSENNQNEANKRKIETNKQNIIQKDTITSTLEGHKLPPKTQRESEESSDLTLSSDVKNEIQQLKYSNTTFVQIEKNDNIKPARLNTDNSYSILNEKRTNKNILKSAKLNVVATSLNAPEVNIFNDENLENVTFENENQMASVNPIQNNGETNNEGTITSSIKKIKRINAYTVEAQIKFIFRVNNAMIAERIASRLNEWMCTYTQIMEDALTDILQRNRELVSYHPPPWTLQEAIHYVRDVFGEDRNSPIEALVNKLTQTLPQSGPPKQDMSPHDFMKILGSGILLIKYLNSILKSSNENQQPSELDQAEEFLLELVAMIEEEPVAREDEDATQMVLGRNDDSTGNSDYQERRNYVKSPAQVVEYLQRHFPAWSGRGDAEMHTEYYEDKSKVIRTYGRNVKYLTLTATKSKEFRKVEDNHHNTNTDSQNTDNFSKDNDHEQPKKNVNNERIEIIAENKKVVESGAKLLKRLALNSLGRAKSKPIKEINIEKREASMRKMTDMLDSILDKGKTKCDDLDSVIVNKREEKIITTENNVKDVSEDKIDEYDRIEAFKAKHIELQAGIHLPVKCIKNQDKTLDANDNKYGNWGPIVIQDKITETEKCEKETSSKDDSAKDSKSTENPKKELKKITLVKTNLVPSVRHQNNAKKNNKKNKNKNPKQESCSKKRKKKGSKTKNIKEPKIQEPGVSSNTVETSKNVKCDPRNTANDLDALDYSAMDEDYDNKPDHPPCPDNLFGDIDDISLGNTTVSGRLVIAEDFDYDSQNDGPYNTNDKNLKNTESMIPLDNENMDSFKMFFKKIGRCFIDIFEFVKINVEEFRDVTSVTQDKRTTVIHKVNKILDRFGFLVDELECITAQIAALKRGKKLNSSGTMQKCLEQARIIKGQVLNLLSLAEGNYDLSLTSSAASLILPYKSDSLPRIIEEDE